MENVPEKVQYSLLLKNGLKKSVGVILEPWFEKHELAPGHNLRVVAEGPKLPNILQIEYSEECITVYGWTGSSVEIQEIKS